jgi:hypothetical protein
VFNEVETDVANFININILAFSVKVCHLTVGYDPNLATPSYCHSSEALTSQNLRNIDTNISHVLWWDFLKLCLALEN